MSKVKSSLKRTAAAPKKVTNSLAGMLDREISKSGLKDQKESVAEPLAVVAPSETLLQIVVEDPVVEIPAISPTVVPCEELPVVAEPNPSERETTVQLLAEKSHETAPSPIPKGVGGEATSVPLYQRLERKEVRFRFDQIEALTSLSRRLSRARRGTPGVESADRITENTLVRVAVDLLLEHGERLHGTDEAALLVALRSAVLKELQRADTGA